MQLKHMLMAVGVSAGWGCNFVAAKIGVQELPPLLLLTLRFVLVAALLIPFVPRPTVPWKHLWLQAFLLGVGHFALMFAALAMGLDASSAVIATQLGVPFSCLLSAVMFNDRPGRWRSLGLFVAFAGVMVIAGTPAITRQYIPFLVCCVAAVAWAAANIAMKRVGEVHILSFLAYMSLLCVPQLFVLSVIFESSDWPAPEEVHLRTWAALGYTVLFSTIVSYGLWFSLLGRYPVSQVTPFSLLVPVFGIGSAQIFLSEPLSMQFTIGAAIIMAGVGIIMLRVPKMGIFEK